MPLATVGEEAAMTPLWKPSTRSSPYWGSHSNWTKINAKDVKKFVCMNDQPIHVRLKDLKHTMASLFSIRLPTYGDSLFRLSWPERCMPRRATPLPPSAIRCIFPRPPSTATSSSIVGTRDELVSSREGILEGVPHPPVWGCGTKAIVALMGCALLGSGDHRNGADGVQNVDGGDSLVDRYRERG